MANLFNTVGSKAELLILIVNILFLMLMPFWTKIQHISITLTVFFSELQKPPMNHVVALILHKY